MYENVRAKYSLASSMVLNLLTRLFESEKYVDSTIFIIALDFFGRRVSIIVSVVCFGSQYR
jgi:hypothetical protein